MPEFDTREWQEFLEARNELEAANEYYLSLVDKYTSVTTAIQPGQPLRVMTAAAKAEMAAAEERLNLGRDRLRRAQERVR